MNSYLKSCWKLAWFVHSEVFFHSNYSNPKFEFIFKSQILNCTCDRFPRRPSCRLYWLFLRISSFCVWKTSWSISETRQYLSVEFFVVSAHVRNAQKQAVTAQNDFSFTSYLRSAGSVLIWNGKIDIWGCSCRAPFLLGAWTPRLLQFFSPHLIMVFFHLVLRQ